MRSPPPSDRLIITVKLPEGAFQLARTSPNVTLPATILAKIQATPIDLSLGNDQLCRRARLTLAEAKVVHEYYRRSADAFARIRDSARALICAKARASVRQELWSRRRGPQPLSSSCGSIPLDTGRAPAYEPDKETTQLVADFRSNFHAAKHRRGGTKVYQPLGAVAARL